MTLAENLLAIAFLIIMLGGAVSTAAPDIDQQRKRLERLWNRKEDSADV